MSPLSRVRILVTEDDPDTRDLLEIILAHANCEVVTTGSSSQALALARNRAFDLYLLDSRMAEMGGVELCQKLREQDSKTPILFYSGAAHEMNKQEAFAAGAQGYLVKPCDPDELVSEVLRLTSRRGQAA